MQMTQDEVFAKVKGILVDTLGVEEEQVTPEAAITTDLGAESIDYLDIVFRLEKSFNIRISPGELFPDNVLNRPEYVANGKLTAAGLAKLKESTPHIDYSNFEKDPDINKMLELVKVQTIVNFIMRKANA